MNASARGSRGRCLSALVAALALLLLPTCCRDYSNPVDPSGTNYQGYPLVATPDDIVLGSPIDGESVVQGSTIPLVVSRVLSASEYEVQVSLTSDPFEDGVVFEVGGETHTMEIPGDSTFPGRFSWRARARVGSDDWGQWSDVGSFTVLACLPTIASWETMESLPESRHGYTSVASGTYLYVIGGDMDTGPTAEVLYAEVNGDGTLQPWQSTTALPSAVAYHASVAYGGYIYVIGGDDGTEVDDVLYAAVGSDGSLGAWQSATSLPAGRYDLASAVAGGYLYVVGGNYAGAIDEFPAEVLSARINDDGSLGVWTETTALPLGRRHHAAATYGGYLYVLGGYADTALADVLYAPLNGDGSVGSWQTATELPNATGGLTSLIRGRYLYALGGDSSEEVVYASPNEDGTLGNWQDTAALPSSFYYGVAATVCDGHLYVTQGDSTDVYRASFDTTQPDESPVLPETSISPDGGFIEDSLSVTIRNPSPGASIRYTLNGTAPTPDSGTKLANGGNVTLSEPGTLKAIAYLPDVATSPVAVARFTMKVATPTFSPASGAITGSTEVTIETTTADATIYYTLDGSTPDADTGTEYTGAITVSDVTTVCAIACCDGYLDSRVVAKTYGPEGALGAWRATESLPQSLACHATVAADGHIYVIGGLVNGAQDSSEVLCAEMDAEGKLGLWQRAGSLPSATCNLTSVVFGAYVYAIGGIDWTEGTTDLVLFAPINADGTLGSWHTTTNLPSPRFGHASAVAGGHVYAIGGVDDSSSLVATVFYAAINANGTLGPWQSTTSLPSARYYHSIVVSGDHVYVIGGDDGMDYLADVLCAPINADGTLGSWQSTTSLPFARSGHTTVVAGGRIYVIGGDGYSDVIEVLYAPASADGTLGSWQNSASLPSGRYYHAIVLSGDHVYVIGGYDGIDYLADVLYAGIVQ